MKKIIYALALLVAFGTALVSCHSDDTTESTSFCYITSFKLGAVKRTMHTTSTLGADSTYTTTVSASTLRMAIDHRSGTITNVDLLPKGCQLDKVPVTVTANGTVFHACVADTSAWTVYSSTDTLDFTQPVLFRVLANNGYGYHDYTVKLQVRDNNADDYTWRRLEDISAMRDMTAARLVSHTVERLSNGPFPVLLASDANGQCYATTPDYKILKDQSATPSASWTATLSLCEGLDADCDVTTAVSYADRFWMTSLSGKLFVADDPKTWSNVETSQAVRLVTASSTALYAAILTDGSYTMASSTDGLSWTPMAMEGSGFTAPLTGLAYTQTNGNRRVLVLADAYDGTTDAPLFAWSLLEGSGEAWLPFNEADTKYALPRWQHPTLLSYNNWLMALGDNDLSGKHKALYDILISHDNGLNWKDDSYLSVPSILIGTKEPVTAMAYGEYVWIIAGTQQWLLRYNSYGE